MIKKRLEGYSNKELLLLKNKERLHSFLLDNGKIRGSLLHGTLFVKEMRLNHDLGILETFILGQAYLGIALMTSNIKKDDRIALKLECSGPLKGLYVESNSHGEIRGYLKANPIPINKPLESFDISPFLGEGFIEVIHFPEYAKQPYTGHIKLKFKNLASDLANYYLESEQTPTYFNLSIKFNKDGTVTGAGGLLLQTMPDAGEDSINKLENIVKEIPSIGGAFADGIEPEIFIKDSLKSLSPKILSNKRVEFFCPCNMDSMFKMLSGMDKKTREDIAKNGPFPLEIKCHNCNTVYKFDEKKLQELNKIQ
jgi:molecular chaperone Hsp33